MRVEGHILSHSFLSLIKVGDEIQFPLFVVCRRHVNEYRIANERTLCSERKWDGASNVHLHNH